jgi:hypothetical protein
VPQPNRGDLIRSDLLVVTGGVPQRQLCRRSWSREGEAAHSGLAQFSGNVAGQPCEKNLRLQSTLSTSVRGCATGRELCWQYS